ncbi:hypothetical protein [Legionella longbeachae]|uniref:Uncharacterized protein n=1 Tax=Legionella longbeachae serogroup 1 (strain NSW150) TaxID=661367 RepID=D3HN44_LEGLN|nr:hypothetical protein [Legionella longbeachae]VEE04410.1 Uncharacterised protein [Legionella oakridgensis]HBD7397162.1 hypothetical protein [Legionella pneumophila]ARB92771.1 hypothetical protein A6J40_11550 [Legionella longbeachae]ARM34064.1 hypothetical protein B0B39_11240 [Legionella longbeachae]EEZ96705.1 hypothetical protein LLB_1901 [Legionella longbeachae D-4968]
MKFKELTAEALAEEIRKQNKNIQCQKMFRTIFYMIDHNPDKYLPLKLICNANDALDGPITEFHKLQTANDELKKLAEQKLMDNFFCGVSYENPDASLKFHVNINNIGELNKEIVLGLVKLLSEEALERGNCINFNYKIIDPSYSSDKRFKNTDQITIYFNKYSSVDAVMLLAQKIEGYLRIQGVPENKTKLGPKDSLSLNSFVSARFDNNKLTEAYDVYTFFDLELKKFFERYENKADLKGLPVGAIEAVFNSILTNKEITRLRNKASSELCESDSHIVQVEFDRLVKDPINYMRKANNLSEQNQMKPDVDMIVASENNQQPQVSLSIVINETSTAPVHQEESSEQTAIKQQNSQQPSYQIASTLGDRIYGFFRKLNPSNISSISHEEIPEIPPSRRVKS